MYYTLFKKTSRNPYQISSIAHTHTIHRWKNVPTIWRKWCDGPMLRNSYRCNGMCQNRWSSVSFEKWKELHTDRREHNKTSQPKALLLSFSQKIKLKSVYTKVVVSSVTTIAQYGITVALFILHNNAAIFFLSFPHGRRIFAIIPCNKITNLVSGQGIWSSAFWSKWCIELLYKAERGHLRLFILIWWYYNWTI